MTATAVRRRVAVLLESQNSHDKLGRWFDWFLIILIIANVIAVMLSTVADIQDRYHRPLLYFEVFSVVIFTVEYGLRVWSCVELSENPRPNWKVRLKYLTSPMAVIDLLAILPFYLALFLNLDLRVLRIIRLVRVAKLGRYASAMALIYDVFRREYKVMLAALLWLLVLMIIASSGIYLIERDVQPDKFGSIPQAMWWAMATLTTVGYGDVTPVTALGKFFGGSITVISMAMVALPAGILASSFSEQLRKRREKFRARVKAALEDGKLDHHEIHELEHLRQSLGMDKEEARELLDLDRAQQPLQEARTCPHCGKPIDTRDSA